MDWPPKNLPRDFPLTIHKRGYVKADVGWVCGKKTPEEALAIYYQKAAAKLAKGQPVKPVVLRHTGDDQSIDELATRWLLVKKTEADDGDIELDHYAKCGLAVASFTEHVIADDVPGIGGTRIGSTAYRDLTPDHFADWARSERRDNIKRTRRRARLIMAMFNMAAEEDWVDRPVKFGKRFRQAATDRGEPIRKHPPTAEQIRAVLRRIDEKIATAKARPGRGAGVMPAMKLRAAIILAVIGGYGATDLSELPIEVIDLDNAIIDYRRGKTKLERVVPLCAEAVAALRPIIEHAKAKGHPFPFITREGHSFVRQVPKLDEAGEVVSVTSHDALNQAYSKELKALGFKQKGSGFYKIKDLHVTHADAFGNDRAARLLTGHVQAAKSRDGRASYGVVGDAKLRELVEHLADSILRG